MPEVKQEHSITVEADPADIYRYVADIRRHTEWNDQPQRITKVSEGPLEVGAVFHTEEKYPKGLPWIVRKGVMPIFERVMGMPGYTAAEIVAMEPERRFAWNAWQPIRGGKRALEVHWEIELEPHNGSTLVTQRSHWIPKHRMSDPSMLENSIKEGVRENLAELKRIVEEDQV